MVSVAQVCVLLAFDESTPTLTVFPLETVDEMLL
jgi:hypothetical protein